MNSRFRPLFATLLLLSLFFPDQSRAEHPLSAEARLAPFEVEPEQIAELNVKIHLPEGYKVYQDQFRLEIIQS
jgi:hypothetical protein